MIIIDYELLIFSGERDNAVINLLSYLTKLPQTAAPISESTSESTSENDVINTTKKARGRPKRNPDSNSLSHWKASYAESQTAFLEWINNTNDLENTFKKKEVKLLKYKKTLQPCLIGVKSEVDGTFVYVKLKEGIHYKFTHLLQALDVCFKSHFVLSLDYMFECSNVWKLLELYLYKIEDKKEEYMPTFYDIDAYFKD